MRQGYNCPVKAFRSNAKAQRLVVEAQASANELAAFKTDIGWEKWRDMTVTNPIPAALNEFDSNCDADGTHYTCYAIELDED